MENLHRDSDPFKRHESGPLEGTATVGLMAKLTSAIAWAQVLGAEDIADRLLAVKRDVVAAERFAEACDDYPSPGRSVQLRRRATSPIPA